MGPAWGCARSARAWELNPLAWPLMGPTFGCRTTPATTSPSCGPAMGPAWGGSSTARSAWELNPLACTLMGPTFGCRTPSATRFRSCRRAGLGGRNVRWLHARPGNDSAGYAGRREEVTSLALIGYSHVALAPARSLHRQRRQVPFRITGIHTANHGTVVGRSVSKARRLRRHVLVHPLHAALHDIQQKLRLAGAVRRARVHDHFRRHTLPFQGVVEFVSLRGGHPHVGLAVQDQRGRGDALQKRHGRVVVETVEAIPFRHKIACARRRQSAPQFEQAMFALHGHRHAESEHARPRHAEYGETRKYVHGRLGIVAQRGTEEHDSHEKIHHHGDAAPNSASWVSSTNASASPARRTSNSSNCPSAASRRRTTSSALLAVMCNCRRSRSTLSTPGQFPTCPAASVVEQLMRFLPTTARISPTVPDAISRPLASTTTRSASASVSSR